MFALLEKERRGRCPNLGGFGGAWDELGKGPGFQRAECPTAPRVPAFGLQNAQTSLSLSPSHL